MFTRDDTKAIKGLAVIMMLFHHIAYSPERYPVGFEGFSSAWERFITDGYLQSLTQSSKICVSVFFFLGGYGMYKRIQSGKFCLTDSIISLFKKYWRVFAVFIPIAYIFFRRSGEGTNYLNVIYDYQDIKTLITTIIANFTALSSSLNKEWWFIQTYVCALFLGSIYCALTKKRKSFATEIFIVFSIDILIRNVFPAIANTETFISLGSDFLYSKIFRISSYASAFFAGIVFAKYDAVVRIKKIMDNIPCKTALALIGMFTVIWSRSYIVDSHIDIVYSVFFVVFASVFFDGIKPLKKGMGFLGIHSTNIWLIHSFFCYYFLEVTKIVYLTQSVWLDWLILIAMSLAASILLELLFKGITNLISIIKKKLPDKTNTVSASGV